MPTLLIGDAKLAPGVYRDPRSDDPTISYKVLDDGAVFKLRAGTAFRYADPEREARRVEEQRERWKALPELPEPALAEIDRNPPITPGRFKETTIFPEDLPQAKGGQLPGEKDVEFLARTKPEALATAIERTNTQALEAVAQKAQEADRLRREERERTEALKRQQEQDLRDELPPELDPFSGEEESVLTDEQQARRTAEVSAVQAAGVLSGLQAIPGVYDPSEDSYDLVEALETESAQRLKLAGFDPEVVDRAVALRAQRSEGERIPEGLRRWRNDDGTYNAALAYAAGDASEADLRETFGEDADEALRQGEVLRELAERGYYASGALVPQTVREALLLRSAELSAASGRNEALGERGVAQRQREDIALIDRFLAEGGPLPDVRLAELDREIQDLAARIEARSAEYQTAVRLYGEDDDVTVRARDQRDLLLPDLEKLRAEREEALAEALVSPTPRLASNGLERVYERVRERPEEVLGDVAREAALFAATSFVAGVALRAGSRAGRSLLDTFDDTARAVNEARELEAFARTRGFAPAGGAEVAVADPQVARILEEVNTAIAREARQANIERFQQVLRDIRRRARLDRDAGVAGFEAPGVGAESDAALRETRRILGIRENLSEQERREITRRIEQLYGSVDEYGVPLDDALLPSTEELTAMMRADLQVRGEAAARARAGLLSLPEGTIDPETRENLEQELRTIEESATIEGASTATSTEAEPVTIFDEEAPDTERIPEQPEGPTAQSIEEQVREDLERAARTETALTEAARRGAERGQTIEEQVRGDLEGEDTEEAPSLEEQIRTDLEGEGSTEGQSLQDQVQQDLEDAASETPAQQPSASSNAIAAAVASDLTEAREGRRSGGLFDFAPDAVDEPTIADQLRSDLEPADAPGEEPGIRERLRERLSSKSERTPRRKPPRRIPTPRVRAPQQGKTLLLNDDWVGTKQGFLYRYNQLSTGKEVYSRKPITGKVPASVKGKGSVQRSQRVITRTDKPTRTRVDRMGVVDKVFPVRDGRALPARFRRSR